MEQNNVKFLSSGTLLNNKYVIERHIASGGFGNTYLARNHNGDKVAIKEFYLSGVCTRDANSSNVTVSIDENKKLYDTQKQKFFREAQRINQLSAHPNIVKVFDSFKENGTAYYVMDYIDGKSLAQVAKPIPEYEVTIYLDQILSALEFVHSQGILHLDIKPNNIMIDGQGRAILIDFGASKQYDVESDNKSMLSTTGLAYTPGYAPIEQTGNQKKKVGTHSDIYSLGATLYNLLTGEIPPTADEILEDGIPHLEKLSPKFRRVIEAAMTVVPKERVGNVKEFRQLLSSAPIDFSTKISVADPKTKEIKRIVEVKQPTSSKRKWVVWSCIVVSLIAIAAGAYAVIDKYENKNSESIIDIDDTNEVVAKDNPSNHNAKEPSKPVKETPKNDVSSFYDEVGGVSFKMIKVDGGSFMMGGTSEQKTAQDDEFPVHKVTLSDYYIAETEVSQALWEAVMGSNPSHFKGDNRPVEKVSWKMANDFCKRLSDMTGRTYRLPTEAQWEFAARGGNKDVKGRYAGSDNINQVACYYNTSNQTTRRVDAGVPNELGLYNMSGNVTEWCSDWYAPSYQSEEQYNPAGPSSGSCHVGRGGQWGSPATSCRVSNRDNFKGNANYAQFNSGFRIVCYP